MKRLSRGVGLIARVVLHADGFVMAYAPAGGVLKRYCGPADRVVLSILTDADEFTTFEREFALRGPNMDRPDRLRLVQATRGDFWCGVVRQAERHAQRARRMPKSALAARERALSSVVILEKGELRANEEEGSALDARTHNLSSGLAAGDGSSPLPAN